MSGTSMKVYGRLIAAGGRSDLMGLGAWAG